jgi:hypothetical protein
VTYAPPFLLVKNFVSIKKQQHICQYFREIIGMKNCLLGQKNDRLRVKISVISVVPRFAVCNREAVSADLQSAIQLLCCVERGYKPANFDMMACSKLLVGRVF